MRSSGTGVGGGRAGQLVFEFLGCEFVETFEDFTSDRTNSRDSHQRMIRPLARPRNCAELFRGQGRLNCCIPRPRGVKYSGADEDATTTQSEEHTMSATLPRKALISISSYHGVIYPDGTKTGLFYTDCCPE
jgi:hypothetical protein